MAERADGIYIPIGGDAAPLRKELSEASRLGSKFASDLTRAFSDAALKGRSLADVLRSLALALSSHALEAALAPITSVLGKSVAGLFGSAPKVPREQHVGVAERVAVNTLADKVQELINSGADPVELQAFVDTLRANDTAVSDAIKARTAAVSEPAPVPVEPQVQPES